MMTAAWLHESRRVPSAAPLPRWGTTRTTPFALPLPAPCRHGACGATARARSTPMAARLCPNSAGCRCTPGAKRRTTRHLGGTHDDGVVPCSIITATRRVSRRLERLMTDTSATVRRHAVHSIACQRCKPEPLLCAAVDLLLDRVAHDPSPRIRRVAAHQLGCQPRDDRIAQMLRPLLRSERSRRVRSVAEWAIEVHSGDLDWNLRNSGAGTMSAQSRGTLMT